MTQSTTGTKAYSGLFQNLSVGKKLTIGFATVLLIMMFVVVNIEVKLTAQGELQDRVVDLRFPTNIAGHDLMNGINHSLAVLRGYMILNKESFKQERLQAWQKIDHNLSIMTQMSENWTAPKNIERLEQLKSVLADFRLAQQQVEDISNTIDERPAMKILLKEAVPRASRIVQAISMMIEEEKGLPANPERKALLGALADSRGSFAMGIASIRAYLISGDQKWVDDFNQRWVVNSERLKAIEANRQLLTEKQQQQFEIYTNMRQEFAPVPPRMFQIRSSEKWNMANYLLATEAAPQADEAQQILNAMVENQNQLVAADIQTLREVNKNAQRSSIIAATLALLVGGLIAWWITRMIVGPLIRAKNVVESIAKGDLTSGITITSKDEVGQLLEAMKQMQKSLSQVIEKDIQSIVDAARAGDLTQRVELEGKVGFYEKLSRGVNDVVRSGDTIVRDTVRVFGALARGDLSETYTREYQGSYDVLKQDANCAIAKIKSVVEGDIQSIVNAARAGDLSKQIDLENKQGFFKELSDSVNQLISTVGDTYEEVDRVMDFVAQGNLTHKFTTDYDGIYGEVKDNINATVDHLQCVLSKIGVSSDAVHSASQEINKGSTNLAERTEHQASTLEKTAAAMEQLTSTVMNNANNSQEASQIAESARGKAIKGGRVVNEAISAMDAITKSSTKITEIIGVIDEIAFQTNLLALNASVEAARAGEQGRGFAVVATEVRNLAQRSATAANEIKELITESGIKVNKGADLVHEAGGNLAEIVDGVKDVSNIISEIATASNEQSIGVSELNKAVMHLDEVTRSNAALAEEVQVSSELSSQQANGMRELIGFFTVTDGAADEIREVLIEPQSKESKLELVRSTSR